MSTKFVFLRPLGLRLLNEAYPFGVSNVLDAPQAKMMKTIVEGIMSGNLPWGLIILGACIAIVVELVGIPVLPFAIGVYLPIQLNACIMVGGMVRLAVDCIKDKKRRESSVNNGILYCSGMIAGEGLVGILLAFLAIVKIGDQSIADIINLEEKLGLTEPVLTLAAIVLFVVAILSLVMVSKAKKGDQAETVEE